LGIEKAGGGRQADPAPLYGMAPAASGILLQWMQPFRIEGA